MMNTDWIRREEQKHFKMGYDVGVLETQLDQAKERNFCSRCGKRLMSALGPVSLHTCCPPTARTGWDNGLSQDYNKELGAWFSEKPNAKQELRETLAQPAQEPVMEYDKEELRGTFWDTISPKRKEWVKLEAEHIDEITHTAISIVDSMLLTETKLKELNK